MHFKFKILVIRLEEMGCMVTDTCICFPSDKGGGSGVGHTPPRLVPMTHNRVEQQAPLSHHSMHHDRGGNTVILFPDIPPAILPLILIIMSFDCNLVCACAYI